MKGKEPKDPGVVAPLHLAESPGHARVEARGVVGRIGGMLRYTSWLRAQSVGRTVETMACPVCFFKPASRGLPLAEGAR